MKNFAFVIGFAVTSCLAGCAGAPVGWGGTHEVISESPDFVVIKYDSLAGGRSAAINEASKRCSQYRRTAVQGATRSDGLLSVVTFRCDVNWDRIVEQQKVIRTDCHNKLLSGEIKTVADEQRCGNKPIRALHADGGDMDLDILDAYLSSRLAGAAKLDRGEIGPEEYADIIAHARKEAVSEAERRANGRMTTRAIMTPQPAPAPMPMTCISNGGITNCF